ncbi:MAG: AAA family ATPase [Desulfatirhabdiaceae bacterium]
MNMIRKKLPIGLQTFREIREDRYYYVDKSGYAVDMADQGKYYFLSRPRRFGKNLLVDTIKELFEGNRDLFVGLAAENRWDWSISHPVLKFSFGGGGVGTLEGLRISLDRQLRNHEVRLGYQPGYQQAGARLADLIQHARERTGQNVVILVDEYDKPILDALADRQAARINRNELRDFYSVIKDNDAFVRFAFLTGVSKFSKASIFSGLNNLLDITVDARWSALCGYTEADLEAVFSPELEGLDREEVRRWYNGYNWLGEKVYNPFDILVFFAKRTFAPYWFETGTPTFLVDLLMERGIFTPDLNRTMATEMLLSTFDVDTMPTEALLFQTGYLTIAASRIMAGRTEYRLGYPNLEVQTALNDVLLKSLMADHSRAEAGISRLYDTLAGGDFNALEAHFKALFASIPFDWHRKNDIARYEGYYASVFYSHFAAPGLDIRVEDAASRGRVDMTVFFQSRVFVFEFKVVKLELEGRAMDQLLARDYVEKYRNRNEPVFLIGVAFSRETRTVDGFEARAVENIRSEIIP